MKDTSLLQMEQWWVQFNNYVQVSKSLLAAPVLYRVRTLTSDNTEESENSPESPHLGKIKCMRKQCVPGTSLFFVHTGGKAKH